MTETEQPIEFPSVFETGATVTLQAVSFKNKLQQRNINSGRIRNRPPSTFESMFKNVS